MWKVGKEGIKFVGKEIFNCQTFFKWNMHFPNKLDANKQVSTFKTFQSDKTLDRVTLAMRAKAIFEEQKKVNRETQKILEARRKKNPFIY